jgi:16S rRNA processing protein RimM
MKDPQITPPNQESNPTGSPQSGEPEFLAVGRVIRPPFQINSARPHGQTLMIKFKGIDNREQAAAYGGQTVFVQTEKVPRLPDGEYYFHQLIGLTVIDEQGQVLGTLESILETRANDVYIIKTPDGSDLLLPAVENEVILGVDLERREMRVRPPEWE